MSSIAKRMTPYRVSHFNFINNNRPRFPSRKQRGAFPSPSSSASEMHDIVYADSLPRPPPNVAKNAPRRESRVFEEIRFDGLKIGQESAVSPTPCIHFGKMECNCGHALGCVPFSLDTTYFHSDDCKWLCCSRDWSKEECVKPSQPQHSLSLDLGPLDHPGLMMCEFLHKLGRVSFPLGMSYLHSDDCKCNCCNLEWHEASCTANRKFGRDLIQENSHHKGLMACNCSHCLGRVPFPLKAGQVHLDGSCKWMCCDVRIPQGTSGASPGPCTHRGMMKCNFGHRLGRVPFPLDTTKYFHSNDCKWLCCSRVWSKEECPNSADTSPSPHVKAGQTDAGHQGLLICKCAHKLGKVPFPLDKSCHHLDDICKWTCCKLDWNTNICER